jgi:c-di-GMP-binding flagellar brake protein YcgR
MMQKTYQPIAPLGVGDKIILRLPVKEQQESVISSQLIGYREGDFIIIEEPTSTGELPDIGKGHLVCVCIREGIIYYFKTKVRKHLEENLVLIDYPDQFREKRLRKNPRIRVNVESKLTLGDEEHHQFKKNIEDYIGKTFKGTMVDISEGGCLVFVRSFRKILVHSLYYLDFILPDGQKVDELEAMVVNCKPGDEEHTFEVGLEFRGPMEQLAKVFFFCQLGMAIQGLEV